MTGAPTWPYPTIGWRIPARATEAEIELTEARATPARSIICTCPDTYRAIKPEEHHESCPVVEPVFLRARIAALSDAIAHGDEDHRRWLREAISAHFAGQPLPPPYGKATHEAKIAAAEAERDTAAAMMEVQIEHVGQAEARIAALTEALAEVTDHFADIMGGPMIAGRGVQFANGVEGIPTIAKARAALSQPAPGSGEEG